MMTRKTITMDERLRQDNERLRRNNNLLRAQLMAIGGRGGKMSLLGDYVIETDGQAVPTWCVRLIGSEEYISNHNTKADALSAVRRYQASDKRRARSTI
jgi:hypothetical protein